MNIAELKELIADLPDDAEVRIAHQPKWPFEYSVGASAYVEVSEPTETDDDESDPIKANGAPGVLFLAEGIQLGYLPRQAKEELRW